MPPQVITIARKKYATGLFWQPVPPEQSESKFIASLMKFVPGRTKFVTQYHGMVGIGSRALRHSAGMPAAATEVVDTFGEYNSFLAAFAVPQGIWLLAVRQGIILLDQLYATEDEARAEYGKYLTLPDWGVVVAPSDWAVDSAVEKLLMDIVRGDTKYKMRAIGFLAKYSGLIFALVLAFVAVWLFRHPIAEYVARKSARPGPAPDPMLVAQYKQNNTNKAAPISAVAPVPPWETLPAASARADQCWRGIAFVMQQVPGWKHVSAVCDQDNVSAKLQRGFGAISDLGFVVQQTMPNAAVSIAGENNATIAADLSVLPSAGVAPKFAADAIARDVGSIFQIMNMPVQINQSFESAPDGRADIVEIAAASKIMPVQFAKIFDGFGPVDMRRITWDNAARQWNYEVIIYAK